ncbi:CPBP family intramembrane metalloprotease [Acetobacterium fimetarium]|uniref:CPBP family intramembrane metalloprotease n=2 Tax=Acetobacterium fimetarium TaxID=52691 RepID=A0ABR6WR43_9FIRM|nr:CPBP family intramembrane metalloprotease [Acetobacterium fimetarium]
MSKRFQAMEKIESATAGSTSVSMFLYASFLGPITEEIVFRGFVLRSLEKYGKHFAIVTSAIMFGLFHANFIQGIFAILVGLILAYVALEYSIKWSIAFHIVNNFIFGDVLFFILGNFESTSAMIAISVLDLIFFIGGIYIICFRRKKEVHQYLQLEKANRELYLQTFTTIWMLLFMTAEILTSFMGITTL